MDTVTAKRLAARVGMNRVVATYKSCLIGYCAALRGLHVATQENGLRGTGFRNIAQAKQFIDKLYK